MEVPLMLLHNINQSCGLCNGTRLIVTHLASRVIQAEVITGNNIGSNRIIMGQLYVAITRVTSRE
ncbi:PIF1 domain-containing protein [Cephalotus follicularis]|uniref:PIF1 domain-containing protein n=1 Tax=Cephalotus follicularis TaxID=3775 RepID=A0A1Q3CDW6_CEPFO|nr:PIF1 domain-containing protein [Cephalotus follicularis]